MVAEKPSMAKQISQLLVGNSSSLEGRPGKNKYCKNIHFPYKWIDGKEVEIVMTSVLGHLFRLDFPKSLSNWKEVPLESLFTAPIVSEYIPGMESVGENLKNITRSSSILVIWTDCDREGEYIGDEIRTICLSQKPGLTVLRARYSVISSQELRNSIRNLTTLDQGQIEAARCRSELDLRTGAIFTRLQTLSIKDSITLESLDKKIISYGSCQFPTLGFVVEQYLKVLSFKEEEFWFIKLELENRIPFTWERIRIFDRRIALILYEGCFTSNHTSNNPMAIRAKIIEIKKNPTKKLKPLPLRTVELLKISSRLLKISSDRLMSIAESLYNKGFISYPRTETDQYDDAAFPFKTLIDKQKSNPLYSSYIEDKMIFSPPRKGNNNDKSHPPIHPTKGNNSELTGLEERVFDFIVCRFLASCSEDATGEETSVRVSVGIEMFKTSGLVVCKRGFLDCYRWEKWAFGDSEALSLLIAGMVYEPTSFKLESGKTSAPKLLSESDLISCMDKNGIGTDATIHEHIKKIIERSYVIRVNGVNNPLLLPSNLGLSLVVGYDKIGLEHSLTRPLLRSDFEKKLSMIASGRITKISVINDMVLLYTHVLRRTISEIDTLLSVIRSNSSNGLYDGADFGSGGGGGGGYNNSSGGYNNNSGGYNNSSGGYNNSSNTKKRSATVKTAKTTVKTTVKTAKTTAKTTSKTASKTAKTEKTTTKTCEKCSQTCQLLTVKKDGPNKGREFYSCSACNTFTWMDEKMSKTSNNSKFATDNIKCSCGLIPSRLITKKKGPNEGKYFLQCSRVIKKCSFFEWE